MPSLVFVTPVVPDPRREGSALRIWHVLRIFAQYGFTITILPIQHQFKSIPEATIRERTIYWESSGIQVLVRNTSFLDYISRIADTHTLFWYDAYISAEIALPRLKTMYPKACHAFDTVDLAHRRFFREAKIKDNKKLLLRAIDVKRKEYALAAKANVTIMISKEEEAILKKDLPSATLFYLPNVHPCQHQTPQFENRNGVSFVGNYLHTPNLDAVNWFIKEIWPLCLERSPDLRLNLVGSGPLNSLNLSEIKNVNLVGYVNDLEDFLSRSRLTIAPLRFGAGIKGKVLFSLSQGIPCVGTTVAAEGMEFLTNKGFTLAESPEAFAVAVEQLHNNQDIWSKQRNKGLYTVEKAFGLSASEDRIKAFIDHFTPT